MPIGLIFATTEKGLFGVGKGLPWKCPTDMEFFKKMTLKRNVVMGSSTMLGLPSPLKDRTNLVITSKFGHLKDGFEVFSFTDLFFESKDKGDPYWVIGGKSILNQMLDFHYNHIDVIAHNIIPDECVKDGINLSSPDGIYFDLSKLEVFALFPDVTKETINLGNGVISHIYTRKSKFRSLPKLDQDYLSHGMKILQEEPRDGRNGLTRSSFDPDIMIKASFGRRDSSELPGLSKSGIDTQSFPILQTKRVWFKGVKEELDFFLSGKTDTRVLESQGVNIWRGNTNREFLDSTGKSHYEAGDMGPMYGFQWRHFGETYKGFDQIYAGLDQIERVVRLLTNDPNSRRILLTTYNAEQASEGVLYPCHGLITQFYVKPSGDGRPDSISLKTYQRSADWFLGVPFNISSYALLLQYIVDRVNLTGGTVGTVPEAGGPVSTTPYLPGDVITYFGDAHIYEAHVTAFLEQYIYAHLLPPDDGIRPYVKDGVLYDYKPRISIKADMVA